ncbi:MAG: sulfotransferase, partial [Alphaproteobacteria bacterium]|nr:sulfotransferase [Alphaproteobacteria bacterium]
MIFPPLGHLIGAQKAATTSLAALLAAHPAVRVSEPKETHFLTAEWRRGPDWWRDRFAPGGEVLVDASTTCAMLALPGFPPGEPPWGTEPPARLAGLRPDARLIYMVRDPVDRLWSAYWHGVRSGWEKRPFDRAVAESPMYLAAGDYAAQAEAWLAHFPREALLFVDFRDFRRDPAGVARRCLAFLGIVGEDMDLPDER